MKRIYPWKGILLIWLLGCRMLCQDVFSKVLTGIDVSGIRGEVDYKAISRWISILLPIYSTIGLWLFTEKKNRIYLMYRYISYFQWWRSLCCTILIQSVGYYVVLLIFLVVLTGVDAVQLTACIGFLLVHTVLGGIFIAAIWERTLFTGSVLSVIAIEYILIAIAYFIPVSYGKAVLPFLGMIRYVSGEAEYLRVCAAEVVGIIVLIILIPKILSLKNRRR